MAELVPSLVRPSLWALALLPLLDWLSLGLQQVVLWLVVVVATWQAAAGPSPVGGACERVSEAVAWAGWSEAPSVEVGTDSASGREVLTVSAAVPCLSTLGWLPLPPSLHASARVPISGP